MLITAAILCVVIGFIHSYLGERFILNMLFKHGTVHKLFGSDYFPKRTLWFAWHITTVAWWGFAYILCSIDSGVSNLEVHTLNAIGVVFLVSGLFSFLSTKGKHLSWVIFWTITVLCFVSAS